VRKRGREEREKLYLWKEAMEYFTAAVHIAAVSAVHFRSNLLQFFSMFLLQVYINDVNGVR